MAGIQALPRLSGGPGIPPLLTRWVDQFAGTLERISANGANSGWTATPVGTAGGILSGNYPNPGGAANAITNAMLAQMAAFTLKANKTGGTATPTDTGDPIINGVTFSNGAAGESELTHYQEAAAWPTVPNLQFGGAQVGLTYTRQNGKLVRIGRVILAYFDIIVNAKGTSLGNATISNLPAPVSADFTSPVMVPVDYGGMVASTSLQIAPGSGGASVALFVLPGATGFTAATDANFANGSQVIGLMAYFT